MPVTVIATPGAANANSYATLAESQTYYDARVATDPAWNTGTTGAAALVMAARVLDSMAVARRVLRLDGRAGPNKRPYYITSRAWTGAPTDAIQAMAWPRTGMFDRLGRAIDPTVIPQALKDAQSELAIQLLAGDRTADNDVSLQGITSVGAGSVSVSFKDMIERQVLPNAVLELMPPSWLTDELITSATVPVFQAL